MVGTCQTGGEFEIKVKISGDYRARFDWSGLMLRVDRGNYIKTGIEFVEGNTIPAR
jgi:regulation of enolase protein 1 (concanavalin A-like superfamily)